MVGESRHIVIFGPRTADLTSLAEVESSRRERVSVTFVPTDQYVGRALLGLASAVVIDAAEQPLLAVAECARIRGRAPLLPIIFLGRGAAAEQAAARRAGATSFLVRPLDSSRIARCLESVPASPGRSVQGTRRIALCNDVVLDLDARQLFIQNEGRRLSSSKFDLLAYFIEHAGRAIAAEELVRERLLMPSQRSRYRSVILELRGRLGPARALLCAVPGYGYRLDLSSTEAGTIATAAH